MAITTLPDVLRQRMASDPARVILRRKDRGIWKPTRWGELGAEVRALLLALQADGFAAGMTGAILADTRPEWAVADLAVQAAGGVSAGLSPFATAAELAAQLHDSATDTLFVENEEQLDKVLDVRTACPALRRIIVLDMKGLRELNDPMCLSLTTFVARGAAAADGWEAVIAALDPDTPAALVYAEQADGPARAVRLTHRALATVLDAAARLFEPRQGDERLAVMPMAHVSERVLGLYLSLVTGCISNYGESAGTLEENLREVKPTVLVAAPALWKRFRDRVVLGSAAATRVQRALFSAAFAAGAAAAVGRAGGGAASSAAIGALPARLVLASVRRELGLSRLRLGLIAGGAVAPELISWFMALGIDPIAVYGPAETAGLAAAAAPGLVRPGDVGRPIVADGLRVAADGAIELAGPAGWYRTGDQGTIAEGRLTVVGAAANVVTPEGGAPVHPEPIEQALCLSPYIADAMVVGEGQPFLSCLLRLDADAVEGWAHSRRVAFTSFAELTRTPELRSLLAAEIARVNQGVACASPIRAFAAMDRRLQEGDVELTLLGGLRRQATLAAFASVIAGELGFCHREERIDEAISVISAPR